MSQDQKGAQSPVVQYCAGRIQELLGALHPEDEKLVLEYLGLNKLDSGTIDPPPEEGGEEGGVLSAKKRGPARPEMRGT